MLWLWLRELSEAPGASFCGCTSGLASALDWDVMWGLD